MVPWVKFLSRLFFVPIPSLMSKHLNPGGHSKLIPQNQPWKSSRGRGLLSCSSLPSGPKTGPWSCNVGPTECSGWLLLPGKISWKWLRVNTSANGQIPNNYRLVNWCDLCRYWEYVTCANVDNAQKDIPFFNVYSCDLIPVLACYCPSMFHSSQPLCCILTLWTGSHNLR